MNDRWIPAGFVVAAGFNILGMGVLTRGFDNPVLFETDPLFSRGGTYVILLWGLAYLAQARTWRVAPAVTAVFALEKVFFATWWALWMVRDGHRLPDIRAADALAGAFYGTYGLGDLVFAGFFGWAAFRGWRTRG